MTSRLKSIAQAVRTTFSSIFSRGSVGLQAAVTTTADSKIFSTQNMKRTLWLAALGTTGYLVVTHPPIKQISRGEIGIRTNQLTGSTLQVREGTIIVLPGIHALRQYNLKDQLYRPIKSSKATGDSPFQSIEGLSIGVDLTVRYAIDPSKLGSEIKNLPEDINAEVVEPSVQGVIYKAFTRYTVKEIFSSKRQEIQQIIEAELKPKLAADGIILRSVMMGKVDLPEDYKRGMEGLLAEELQSEKMHYTLELKEKQVKQTALEADAEKIRREKSAEAAASEQIIAAKAQEEAMKHVLPFKQKQIEQRQYEAEAEKMSRIKTSEGTAQARVIEAVGEADSRRKLADAEAYRQEMVGKIASAQMERDGALISKHPLLIQKIMADKLSDKISVIIAPPPSDGGFIGATLLGTSAKNDKNNMLKKTSADAEAEAPNAVQSTSTERE